MTPSFFALASLPAFRRSSHPITSARMKPRSRSVWIAPAACCAGEPHGTVHARTSSSPTVKNEQSPSSSYVARIRRSSAGSASPSSLRKDAASSGGSSAISASSFADTGTTALAVRFRGLAHGRDDAFRIADVVFIQVHGDEHRHAREKSIAADRLLLVKV